MISLNPFELPEHPCFNDAAHHRIARIHLPVAPKCTVGCGYCGRKIGISESVGGFSGRPGTCREVLKPDAAAFEAASFVREWGGDSIVGIAGPGDPLANSETFETLEKVNRAVPHARLCLCTNGHLLPASLDRLKELNLRFLSVTVNAVCLSILEKIYAHVTDGERVLSGTDAVRILSENQLKGIGMAAEMGMTVKVNTVVIPGVNCGHVTEIARTVKGLGASVMNLMPLIPGGRFRHHEAPGKDRMNELFEQCEPIIRMFRSCRQCGADARGIPGKDGCVWKKTA
jgi:nitrogen fixation protein NifB